MSVSKSSVTSANRYLSESEMTVNAQYIYEWLSSRGWTDNAIAATLANMQSESGINAGIYESLDSSSTTNGYGLVQWTPNTKYKNWADENGFAYDDIDAQLARIMWEMENGQQFYPTDAYPLTFYEYSQSTYPPQYLAYAFMYNYERPADYDQPIRQTRAVEWFQMIQNWNGGTGGGGGGSSDYAPRKSKMSLLLMYGATRR